MDGPGDAGIFLYWIPLGAGGTGFVRMNGRIYEWICAHREHRPRLDIYHTALRVIVPEGRFVVETMWPRPDMDRESRGVVAEGPVFTHRLSGSRIFRYEVRRWPDGSLPDVDHAVGGPRVLSDDTARARHLLRMTEGVPGLTWGRDEAGTGEMWNSNSVISWLLTRSGFDMEDVIPPANGRAPGWQAGIAIARRRTEMSGIGASLPYNGACRDASGDVKHGSD